jgi:hypothetical protein
VENQFNHIVFAHIVATIRVAKSSMSKSSTSKTTEIKKKNEVVSDDLPFIAASGDYENLKITPPKR